MESEEMCGSTNIGGEHLLFDDVLCDERALACRRPTWEAGAILAAESDPADAENLLRCLKLYGQTVLLATSSEDVLRLIRRQVYERAVVGVDLVIGDEPLLARLSSLPALRYLVATGPPGDVEMETLARLAGAGVYLQRPVSADDLGLALDLPPPVRTSDRRAQARSP